MSSDRKNAILAGTLLLIGWVGIFIGLAFGPIFEGADFLRNIPGNEYRLGAGVLIILIMAFACSGIAASFYPTLQRKNKTLALWSVVLRSFEATSFIISSGFLLLLLPLSKAYMEAGVDGPELARSTLRTLGSFVLSARIWTSQSLGIFGWSLGALLYHYLFFTTKLIPRWLSLWGIFGVPLAIAGCILPMFGIIEVPSTVNALMVLPLGLQELPLGLWLIIKGYDTKALAALAPKKLEA